MATAVQRMTVVPHGRLAAAGLLVSLLAAAPAAPAPIASCEQLRRYQSTQLDADRRRAAFKYRLSESARNDLDRAKRQILDDTAWALSAPGSFVAGIVAAMKTMADIADNVVLGGCIGDVVNAERVKQLVETGKLATDVLTDGVLKTVAKETLSCIDHPAARAAKTVWELAEDVGTMYGIPGERKRLRESVREAVERLDAAIEVHEASMRRMGDLDRVFTAIHDGINWYCGEQARATERAAGEGQAVVPTSTSRGRDRDQPASAPTPSPAPPAGARPARVSPPPPAPPPARTRTRETVPGVPTPPTPRRCDSTSGC